MFSVKDIFTLIYTGGSKVRMNMKQVVNLNIFSLNFKTKKIYEFTLHVVRI